jgi:hypothetical protein
MAACRSVVRPVDDHNVIPSLSHEFACDLALPLGCISHVQVPDPVATDVVAVWERSRRVTWEHMQVSA